MKKNILFCVLSKKIRNEVWNLRMELTSYPNLWAPKSLINRKHGRDS